MELYNLWALLSSFFHLEGVFQIPPCTCQHLILTYWQVRVHGIAMVQFVSPLLSNGHLAGCLCFLTVMHNAAISWSPNFVWTHVFILLNIYLYRSGAAGSWENSMFNLSRNCYLFSKLAFWTLQESQHTCIQARHTESNFTETAVFLSL